VVCRAGKRIFALAPCCCSYHEGGDELGKYQETEKSIRQWCKTCGGHLLTEHPLWSLTDVYVAILPELPFQPAVHVNYQETVLPMNDGLPKQKDIPAEMGGSGELLPQ
jgi:hypothetical protein